MCPTRAFVYAGLSGGPVRTPIVSLHQLSSNMVSSLMPPLQIAAPNRRLRLGRVPWSFGTSTSQRPAVGELTLAQER